jgi:hypothetical protein
LKLIVLAWRVVEKVESGKLRWRFNKAASARFHDRAR